MNTDTITNAGYRYPGSRPFNDTEVDRCLFFGRDREKNALLHKVLAGNLVVLYAKSGLGKTSLINAGLNQSLRDRRFIPLPIRLNNPDIDPLEEFYKEIENFVEQNNLDHEKGDKTTLWQYFKTVAFWAPDDTLLKPVVILDQFEEFFALYSSEQRKNFIRQFADLVNNNVPQELWESIPEEGLFPYSEKPPNVKIIISIREDYLGQLEEMSREIPVILHRRFRLLPLSREQAREAIIEPSQVQDEAIHAAAFKYSPGAVEMMLNFLCKREEKDGPKITDEVESFQLQLLCKHIEDKVRESASKGGSDIIVGTTDLGGEAGMQRVLQGFYDHQVDRLGSIWKKRQTHRLCEKGLISAADRRLSLEENEIKRKFRISEDLLAELVNCRLLRSEPRVGSIYYELSHDTLVAPIRESQRKRNFKRNTIGGTIAICLLLVMIFLFQKGYLFTERYMEGKFEEAMVLKEQGKCEEAIGKLESILDLEPNFSKAYLPLGQLYVEIKNFDKAIDTYNKGINIDIKDNEIYYQLGRAYSGRGAGGDSDKAIENYEKALNKRIKKPDLYEELAVLYIEKEESEKAIEVYRQALDVKPGYEGIYRGIATALEAKGEKKLVEKIYDIAFESESKDPSLYLGLGHDYYELRKWGKAIKSFRKAIKLDSDSVAAEDYFVLGNGLYNSNEFEKAIDAYQIATKKKSKYAEAFVGLGNALYNLLKYKEAINAYQKAIDAYQIATKKDSTKYAQAFVGLGNALNKNRRSREDAIVAYEKAIDLNPNNAQAYYGWGYVLNYHYPKGYKEAIDKYRKSIELDPNNPYAYNELGLALMQNNEITEAIEKFNKAIENKPKYALAYYNKGVALRRKGRTQEAIDAFRKAIEYNPELSQAHTDLGNALFSQGRYQEAIKEFDIAIKINPKDSNAKNAYKGKARVYKKLEKYAEAEKELKKALNIESEWDTHLDLGDVYLEQGKYEKAEVEYQKAHKLQPGNADAKAGLAKLYLLRESFEDAFEQANRMLGEKNISRRYTLGMRFVSISALLFRQRQQEAVAQLKKLIKFYQSLPGGYNSDWGYKTIRKFIVEDKNKRLSQPQTKLLLQLVDILESPKAEGDRKLRELQASNPEIFK